MTAKAVSRFVSWLKRRRFVVIDMDGADVAYFRAPGEVRVFIQQDVDPDALAVLIYEHRKRAIKHPPVLGGHF